MDKPKRPHPTRSPAPVPRAAQLRSSFAPIDEAPTNVEPVAGEDDPTELREPLAVEAYLRKSDPDAQTSVTMRALDPGARNVRSDTIPLGDPASTRPGGFDELPDPVPVPVPVPVPAPDGTGVPVSRAATPRGRLDQTLTSPSRNTSTSWIPAHPDRRASHPVSHLDPDAVEDDDVLLPEPVGGPDAPTASLEDDPDRPTIIRPRPPLSSPPPASGYASPTPSSLASPPRAPRKTAKRPRIDPSTASSLAGLAVSFLIAFVAVTLLLVWRYA